jgi:hypothetical protein
MTRTFFKNVSFLGLGLTVLSAAVTSFIKGPVFGAAVVTGAVWIFLNSYFLFRLIELGMNAAPNRKNNIFLLSVVKFPVLYLAGYFILKGRYFPVTGIVLGLTAFMAGMVIVWMVTKK